MSTALALSQNDAGHFQAGHAERPERLKAIRSLLESDGILDQLNVLPCPAAPLETALLVHPQEYLDRLVTATKIGGTQLDPDTYMTGESLEVAQRALGGLLGVTKAVMEGSNQNGFAAVRPPGHHARPHAAMGFCLLANIAIAARWCQQQYDVKKILIVDFDVHHGNGTQEIFYNDPDVFYVSTHEWPLYPGTGAADERGGPDAVGATLNIPLSAGTGDESILKVFDEVIAPEVAAFAPEVIFVSAGYDAHWRDPLAHLQLTVTGFAQIMLRLIKWADEFSDSRLIALLEGGYDTEALAHSVLTTLRLLLDPDAEVSDPF